MSLFRSSLRPPALPSDEAIGRYLAAIREELEPDPLFRRRLRGHVVNRHVAGREGHHSSGRALRREMGRLGRAVLYSSFVLGTGVSGVMAASQPAIPGEILYPVKLQIETIRQQVLPDHLQDELAAYSLGQRIEELHRLADAGRWGLVASHAAAVDAAYESMLDARGAAALPATSLAVINGLIEQLPETTRVAVEAAMSGRPGIGQERAPGTGGVSDGSSDGTGNPGGAHNDGTSPGGGTNKGGANNDGSSGNAPHYASENHGDNAAEPTRGGPNDDTPKPPKPTKTPKPTPNPDQDSSDEDPAELDADAEADPEADSGS